MSKFSVIQRDDLSVIRPNASIINAVKKIWTLASFPSLKFGDYLSSEEKYRIEAWIFKILVKGYVGKGNRNLFMILYWKAEGN